jgi:hypothetical protein
MGFGHKAKFVKAYCRINFLALELQDDRNFCAAVSIFKCAMALNLNQP